jgi:hypothetical protein
LAATPSLSDLFEIDETSPPLEKHRKDLFVSRVMSSLYICQRIQLAASLTVSFLQSRVSAPTEEDMGKLIRLIRYFRKHVDDKLTLEVEGDLCVRVYVDAAYGVHATGHSHTGGLITLGRGAITVKSSKQKIVCKSSTEAELVGISDYLSEALWTREFLVYQGYATIPPVILYQDNTSTILMAKRGRATSERTRHIKIRYFFITDHVSSGEVELVHKPTNEMWADVLTKPLVGEKFHVMRMMLMND